MQDYQLYFMHPQYGTTFQVTVDGALTVTEMIRNLRLSGFLPMAGQYRLARYDKELLGRQTFSEVENLASGDVIRIIAEQAETSGLVRLNLHLPFIKEFIQVTVNQTFTGNQFIQFLCEKGILYRFDADFKLMKGNTEITANQSLSDVGIQDFDLLRVIAEETDAPTPSTPEPEEEKSNDNEAIKHLSQQIETLQAKIEQLEAALLNTQNTTHTATPSTPTPTLHPASKLPFEPLDSLIKKLTN